MADSKSNIQSKLLLERKYDFEWREVVTYQNLRSNELNTLISCLDKNECHRIVVTDSGFNGICCDEGNGWYDVFWNGKISK